jgi:hypothetical protein
MSPRVGRRGTLLIVLVRERREDPPGGRWIRPADDVGTASPVSLLEPGRRKTRATAHAAAEPRVGRPDRPQPSQGGAGADAPGAAALDGRLVVVRAVGGGGSRLFVPSTNQRARDAGRHPLPAATGERRGNNIVPSPACCTHVGGRWYRSTAGWTGAAGQGPVHGASGDGWELPDGAPPPARGYRVEASRRGAGMGGGWLVGARGGRRRKAASRRGGTAGESGGTSARRTTGPGHGRSCR